MRDSDFPNIIDWLAISLRWLVLLGVSAGLILQGVNSLYLSIILLISSFWNISLTLAMLGSHPGLLRPRLVILIDLLIANLLFCFSSLQGGSLGWVVLLPVFTAALYLDRIGVGLVTLVGALSLGVQALFLRPPFHALILVLVAGVLSLCVGIPMNYLQDRMVAALDQIRQERLKHLQESEQAEADRRRAIYDLIAALSSTLNYQRVLDTALDMGTTALSRSTVSIEPLVSAVFLFSENKTTQSRLQVGSARRFTPADLRIELPGTSGLIGHAIDEGEPCLSNELATDVELSRIVALRACHVAYCVPLRTGLDTCGVLLFAHPDENYFTAERQELLNTIGHQAMIAIQNARLYRDLELEKERMMEIQEEARKKLARDLHDGPTQSVAALAMRVNFARRLIERDSKAAGEELKKVEDLARRTTSEIRHMLFTLRPLVLESQGLLPAFESMAEKMRETYNQNVIVFADQALIPRIEMNKQAVLFFIAEEAVNNARKHAQAEHIWLRLTALEKDIAILQIEDDGIGFDLDSVSSSYTNRGSMGMVNMRERAELVNGILHIDSREGRGTRVQVVIPITEEASERLRRRQ